MFSSNVQQRGKKIMRSLESWLCLKCSTENRHYLNRCLKCGERREG